MRRCARIGVGFVVAAVACSVPGKQPAGSDAAPHDTDAGDDPSAPETTIVEAPPAHSASATAMFVFRSDAADATFSCSVDGESPLACTSPFVRTLAEGPHQFTVRAARGDHRDGTPAGHAWTIDTVAPETTLVTAPPELGNQPVVTFTFTADDDHASFECAIDGAGFAPCQSGIEVGPLADGAHSFAVRARDLAGNVDASPALHVWVVDATPPDTLLLSGPSDTTNDHKATFMFVSPDAGEGATFQCALAPDPFTACTSPHTLAGLEDGVRTFSVRAHDAAGNADPTPATRTWIIASPGAIARER